MYFEATRRNQQDKTKDSRRDSKLRIQRNKKVKTERPWHYALDIINKLTVVIRTTPEL
jgi:hypothetical protein